MPYSSCLVGDLHGDLGKARSAFEMAGILSSEGPDLWTGGNTVCHATLMFVNCTCFSDCNWHFVLVMGVCSL